jgi:hypothetical protein
MNFEWTAGMTNPFVYKGMPTRSEREYTVKASQSFKAGELVRITTSGTIVVAAIDSDTTGPVHGIALADAATYLTGGAKAGEKFPVALLNKDCVLGIQINGANAQSAFTVGVPYKLDVTSNKWSLTTTTEKGIAMVVGKSSNDEPFNPQAGATLTRSIVYVNFTQAQLDARGAE